MLFPALPRPIPAFAKLATMLVLAILFAGLAANAEAQIVNYTFSVGSGTQFTTGEYITGTMTVNFGLSGNAQITAANLVIGPSGGPATTTFTLANLSSNGSFSNTVCGTPMNFNEASFSASGDTLFLDYQQSNTTTPIPGVSGVHTSWSHGGTNRALVSTCGAYVPTMPQVGMWLLAAMLIAAGWIATRQVRRPQQA